jgi:hypothetical protein
VSCVISNTLTPVSLWSLLGSPREHVTSEVARSDEESVAAVLSLSAATLGDEHFLSEIILSTDEFFLRFLLPPVLVLVLVMVLLLVTFDTFGLEGVFESLLMFPPPPPLLLLLVVVLL